jgi:isoamylase
VRALREQQKRNLLATLLLSQGVPMLLAGDELGRTQQGNNNAYAQDNEISWIDWQLKPEDEAMIEFVARLIRLRRAHPTFRRRAFYGARHGGATDASAGHEVRWLRPDGGEMSEAQWGEDFARCVGMLIDGSALPDTDERGARLIDDDFLLLFNAHHEDVAFTLPASPEGAGYTVVLDTARPEQASEIAEKAAVREPSFALRARSLVVLSSRRGAR